MVVPRHAALPMRPAAARRGVAAGVFQQQQQRTSDPIQQQQQQQQTLILPGSNPTPSSSSASGLLLPLQQLATPPSSSPFSSSPFSSTDELGRKPLRISWAGSGIYFWWQLGALQYLNKRYDLTQVPQGGASGGALCAALARCGVDPEAIVETAYKLSLENKIWERPLGLVGVWGSIIERWLDELLPHDAAELCRGELGVVVTQLPSCKQLWINDFRDKTDLINCCMASAHVPVLLDLQLSRKCRGWACVDGSFPDFFTGANCDHIQVRCFWFRGKGYLGGGAGMIGGCGCGSGWSSVVVGGLLQPLPF